MSDFYVAFPEGRRFDDRQLRGDDNGRDFEAFVYEALSLLAAPGTFRPGFGRGIDGAIDHLIEGPESRTVVECKFIGRDVTGKDPPLGRWGEVRRHLKDNLPKLATKDPAEWLESQYGPWLNRERRIERYQFCVSYPFSHADDRIALEEKISNDFLELSRQNPHLSHLADIQVQVRGWDDFHGELRRRFPLRYRWFGDLPRGIVPIRDKKFESQSFRRFLFGESLPFFSREKYLAESSGQQVTREEHLVSNLAADRGDEALILAGVGGVGKTRLGLELCDRLSKLGWLTLRLTDNATSASVTELVQAHAETAQIVLFSDYAERADDLSAIAEEISLINEGNSHRVRLISTCRMSALSGVQDALVSLTPREVILATPRVSAPSEIAFTEWVVRQILAFGHIPELDQVARICRGLPILAAFAMFLYQRDAKQFNEQFGDLKEVQDFRDWMKRRLKIALQEQHGPEEREVTRHLALLSLRLPMTRAEADGLADFSAVDRSLLEMMQTDRWIEDNGDSVVAIHDVFADAMVGHYVFETRAVAHGRMAELLRAATDQDFLPRALLAVDRLIGYPDFEAVNGTAIVRALIVRVPAKVIAAHERLLRGRLVSDRGKVELLAENWGLYSEVLANRDCDGAVSHIADTLARMRRSDPAANGSFVGLGETVVAPLLAAGLANRHPSNMLLRRAFALLPGTYRDAVLDRVANEPTAVQTHYLLVAWLHAGYPADEIVSQIGIWLSANAARSLKTSFVVRAWLNAGGQRDLIDRHVLAWIEEFGATEVAQFVYQVWLNAAGERVLIDHHVLAWIGAYGEIKEARFVYKAWLEAGGQRELIDRHILAWIEAFGATEDAGFVYRAWLDVGGQRELIDRHVLAWIEEFGATKDAQYVYRSWLDVGGQRDLIDRHVLAWIEAFGATEDAQFVYRAWLDVGGNRNLIDRHVLAWIDLFGAIEEAQFVYKAWLRAGGDFNLISVHCLNWFIQWSTSPVAAFVLKYISGQRKLPTGALHAAIRWCVRFPADEDTIWRIASILGRFGKEPEGVAIVRAFILALQHLDIKRLQANPPEADDSNANYVYALLSYITLNSLVRGLIVRGLDAIDRRELAEIHARILADSNVYSSACVRGSPEPQPALVYHVAEMIERGLLELHRDREGLARFAAWMHAWPEDASEDLQIAISMLRNAAPCDLWDEVAFSFRLPSQSGSQLQTMDTDVSVESGGSDTA
jgi:hypothetical protein